MDISHPTPTRTHIVGGPDLVILIMNTGYISVRKHWGTFKNKIYYSQILEDTLHTQESHSEVVGAEIGDRAWTSWPKSKVVSRISGVHASFPGICMGMEKRDYSQIFRLPRAF